jgi:hypothetical protein
MSKTMKVATLVSFIWIVTCLSALGFSSEFFIFCFLPITLGWGIWWIRK